MKEFHRQGSCLIVVLVVRERMEYLAPHFLTVSCLNKGQQSELPEMKEFHRLGSSSGVSG